SRHYSYILNELRFVVRLRRETTREIDELSERATRGPCDRFSIVSSGCNSQGECTIARIGGILREILNRVDLRGAARERSINEFADVCDAPNIHSHGVPGNESIRTSW